MATLIGAVIVATFLAVFAGFNIGNCCDVSLAVHTFKNIPVFVTSLVSFAAGVAVAASVIAAKKVRSAKKTSGAVKKAQKDKKKKGFTLFKRDKKDTVKDNDDSGAGKGEGEAAQSSGGDVLLSNVSNNENEKEPYSGDK